MSDPAKAGELARTMVQLGVAAGVKTRALVTAMDVPLGLTAGNALEVRESIEVLAGGGPTDVVELTVLLAREMIDAAGIIGKDPAVALKDGSAMDHWRRMISAQGGDPDAKLPIAREQHVVKASQSGTMTEMDAMKIGVSAWRLGAGRSKQGEKVQAGAGIEMHAKPGDYIKAGDRLLTLHTDEPARFERALEILDGAISIKEGGTVNRLPLVIERIQG
jgi:thymidine phosphorylase